MEVALFSVDEPHQPFGIHVSVVEPGSIQTNWGTIAADKLRRTSGHGSYVKQAEAMAKSLENSSQPGARMTSPSLVIAVFLSKILSNRTFDALIKRASGVPA